MTASEPTPGLVTLTRPDGRVYRAKKPPKAQTLNDEDGYPHGVCVLRTHHIEVARILARAELDREDCEHLVLTRPRTRWGRYVPRGDEWSEWVEDPVRGAPVVFFTAHEPPSPW